jgi:hypothetical protein
MTSNQYRVEPDQLDRHANSLGAVADQLSDVTTRMPDSLGGQSLGSFAEFITAGLQGAMGQATAAIAHAASTSDEMRAGMSLTSEQYRLVEDQNAAAFNGGDLL